MSYEENLTNISRVAVADLSAKQLTCVIASGVGIATNTTAGGQILGVLQNDPIADQVGAIAIAGVSKVVTGAAVAVGDPVQSDAAGKAIKALTGDFSFGTALEASTATGQIIAVSLTPPAQIN